MVWISLQDDVKRSFENVKADILNLKRGINRELLAIEDVSNRLQTFVAKDEFYSFVKRLGERLDRIDENLEAHLGYEDDIRGVDAKVKNLGKKLSRQDDLSGEIKEVRALKGKLEAIEGSTVSTQRFNESIGKASSEISSVRASMLTTKSLDSLKAKLADAERRVEKLEMAVPSKEDVSEGFAAIEELRKSIERVESLSREKAEHAEKENSKRLGDVSGRLTEDIESLRASSVDKANFEKSFREIKKESASIRSVLESSVSEVDFSDYVTKKELVKKLLALEELNSDIRKVAQGNVEMENSLELLKRETASLEDVRRIGADVKEISKSLDSLRGVIEKAVDSSQKRFSQDIEQTRAKFEKEVSRLKDDFGGKLEKLEKERASVKGGEGIISRMGRSFADFFREDEEKEVRFKAKPSPSVSELLKEEEKKKSRKGPGFGRFVMPVMVTGVVVALFLLVFWLANRAYDGAGEIEIRTNDTSNITEEQAPTEETTIEKEPLSDITEEQAPTEKITVENASFNGTEEVSAVPGTTEYCRQEYECKERGDGSYWFSCYLDEEGTCRCFVTDAEGCGVSEEKSEKSSEEVKGGKGKVGYAAASMIVFAIFLALYFLVLRKSGYNSKKQKKVKEKVKEDDDGKGVDLDEFFQKK